MTCQYTSTFAQRKCCLALLCASLLSCNLKSSKGSPPAPLPQVLPVASLLSAGTCYNAPSIRGSEVCGFRTMHRIVPELIIDSYRAGRLSGHFHAAGMFVDLSGFSIITDVLMRDRQRGAEQLSALMYSVFEPVVRVIFEQGGMVLGFAGDAMTAVATAESSSGSRFGPPTPAKSVVVRSLTR